MNLLRSRSSSAPSNRFRPRVEQLEARVNPVTLHVTSALDAGVGTLRNAVNTANALPGRDEIVFDPALRGQTIALTSEIAVSSPVSILGLGRDATTLDGQLATRLFNVTAGGDLALSAMTLTRGTAPLDGGAILYAGALSLTNCLLTDNVAGDDGGAIASTGAATSLSVSESWLRNNSAGHNGGGLYIISGDLTVLNCTFSNNVANNDGGAIDVSGANGANISQSTISANIAGDDGGGIYSNVTVGTNIYNSTVADNLAGTVTANGWGGGMRVVSGGASVFGSIFARNGLNAGTVQGPDIRGSLDNFNFSLISNNTDTTFGGATTGMVVGDPLLGPLATNGGPNPTHALRFGSPAINAGTPLPDLFSGGVDQRGAGFRRNYAGGLTDMGAVEFGSGLGVERVAVGTDAGISTAVRVYDGSGAVMTSLLPYVAGFTGGARVATGDFTGDGVQDIVTAAGPGGGPNVKVFDGVTFQELASFFAFESTFDGGVSLGVADINADGTPDIVAAAGPGGGPRVIVIDGNRLTEQDATGVINQDALLASFFAYVPNFNGGVTISSGDFNGDGRADLAFAAGPGGGPHVRVVDGTLLNLVDAQGVIRLDAALVGDTTDFSSFFAFGDPNFTGGVVLTTGDMNGDGLPDLVVGIASQGGPNVFVRDAATKASLPTFSAFEATFTGGVRLTSTDTNGDGSAETIVAGRGPGGVAEMRMVNGLDPTNQFFDDILFPGFTGGIFVG